MCDHFSPVSAHLPSSDASLTPLFYQHLPQVRQGSRWTGENEAPWKPVQTCFCLKGTGKEKAWVWACTGVRQQNHHLRKMWGREKKISVPELRKQLTPKTGIFFFFNFIYELCSNPSIFRSWTIMGIWARFKHTHIPLCDSWTWRPPKPYWDSNSWVSSPSTTQHHQPRQWLGFANETPRVTPAQERQQKAPHPKAQASGNNPSWQDSRAGSHEPGRFPWWIKAIR